MLSHFRVLPFVGGIVLALLIFAIYKPQKQVMYKYPHPSDTDTKYFKDPNGTCYKYKSHEVNCDANEGTLKDYPIQG
jgi:hypothetical protein